MEAFDIASVDLDDPVIQNAIMIAQKKAVAHKSLETVISDQVDATNAASTAVFNQLETSYRVLQCELEKLELCRTNFIEADGKLRKLIDGDGIHLPVARGAGGKAFSSSSFFFLFLYNHSNQSFFFKFRTCEIIRQIERRRCRVQVHDVYEKCQADDSGTQISHDI